MSLKHPNTAMLLYVVYMVYNLKKIIIYTYLYLLAANCQSIIGKINWIVLVLQGVPVGNLSTTLGTTNIKNTNYFKINQK